MKDLLVKNKLFFIGILLIIIAALIYVNFLKKAPSIDIGQKKEVYPGTVVVKITENGFEPREITIVKGTKVKFINEDTLGHWPASDLHPTHAIYREFDPLRLIPPGESWDFQFLKTGESRYHDHLSPYITGVISVVEKENEREE